MKKTALSFLCIAGACLVPSRSLASAQYRDTTVTVYTAGMLPGGRPGDTSAVSGITDSTEGTWTLRRCIEYAMEENITLKKSRIAVEEAKTDIRATKGELFPNLSFATSQSVINRPYQESSTTVSGTEILQSNSNTSYTGNYGLNAQWSLYNGGRIRKTIRQNELSTRIAELDVENTAYGIMEDIAQLYVQILYAAESVEVNRNTLEVSIAQFERGKELFSAGSISRADYAQLEAQVSNDRYQLVTAQTTLSDYRLQLKQLLELDGNREMDLFLPEIGDSDVLSPLPDKEAVYQAALGIRPEIASGELNVEASELGIRIAKSGYIPSISVSAGIGTSHTSGTDFTFTEQIRNGWNNSLGLTLNVPIFNNRQTKSAVEKARLQLHTSELDLRQARKDLYKTIENLWLDAWSSQLQYTAAKEKLRSTEASFELVSEQFDCGMKNTVELLTEKNNLLSAEQEVLQAKYMAVLNLQLLRFYSGQEIML